MYKVEITNNNKYELELDRANVVVGSGGTVVPVWGTIIGDITQQKDLQEELTGIKESIPDLTQVNEDIANLESVKANKSEIQYMNHINRFYQLFNASNIIHYLVL